MKIILSRKGFDSAAGGQPSPIMPDGTLLSLPIPDPDDRYNTFSNLHWNGLSYYEIIKSLNPKTSITPECHCHLDPDIRKEARDRQTGWLPAFGQLGSSLSVLRNNGVSVGDLFLFFGWFRETEFIDGTLRYKHAGRDLHVIYGYMQIGRIIEHREDVPHWLTEHPHTAYEDSWDKGRNAIFLPTNELSILPGKAGCDPLGYRTDRVLTMDGQPRGRWHLPPFFKKVEITYHPSPWKDGYFQSAGRGQEFVMDAIPEIVDWAKGIIA